MPVGKKEDDNKQVMKALALFTQLGLSMAACIIGGLLLGRFLDGLLGTSPLLLIIFILVGAVAAIKILYDLSKDWK